jgi:valyl-tRNA synthetase
MSVAGGVEVLVGLKGLVEPGREKDRVEREIKKVEKDLAAIDKKLAAPSFAEKAPAQVVAEAREQHEALAGKLGKLREALGIVEELG